ncbi:MAG: ATPase domain-containing protein, partial [Nanoarchaeota archaeon]
MVKKRTIKKNNKKTIRKAVKRKAIKKLVKKITVSKKIQTGIPNFDKLIGGGFEKSSANIIVGGAGSGKTIFATQFLVNGMKKGEKCLYVTFEEKKEQFYKNMLKFRWDLEYYEKKDLFTFLEYTPVKVKTMLDEGGGTIETAILHKGITRVVIDSITSFALLFDKEIERREAALDLFNMIGGWNCTSLLTLEEDLTETKELTSKAIEFESDSIILIYFPSEKGERNRYLEILKCVE